MEAIAVRDGEFVAPDGRLLGSYWAMAEADLLAVEASPEAKPKPSTERRVAGTSAPRRDLPDKVFGRPRFVHDLRLPGMLHARMIRPPSRGAVLRAVQDGALPGGATLFRDGNLLAAVAPEEHHAEAAAERIARHASWDERDTLPHENALEDWLRSAPRESSVVLERSAETSPPAHRVSAAFFRPFLAHASIGPSCAVARWDGATLEVWTHSQGIYNLRTDLAKTLRLPPDSILVRHMEGAGCYGHNGADDVALDAALLARAHPGRPVRVLWSRAEELRWSPFSPAMLVEVQAEADAAGTLTAWRQEVTSNGHSGRPGRSKDPTLLAASMIAEPFQCRSRSTRHSPAAVVRSATPCRNTVCRRCMSACTGCWRCRSARARCAGSGRW
jgi:CO/xanthine dehydrogenase Mo-binding subunit